MAESYQGILESAAKQFTAADLSKTWNKNLFNWSTHDYETATKQMANMKPMWFMNSFVLAETLSDLPYCVRKYLDFNHEFYLRQGAVHTEIGDLFGEIIETEKDFFKPGDKLVRTRGDYPRVFQEESGKDPIHFMVKVDHKKFDFADRYWDPDIYAQQISVWFRKLSQANNLFLNQLVQTILSGLATGAIWTNRGTQLEYLASEQIQPTEQDSKSAKKYFDKDGPVSKIFKKYMGKAVKCTSNVACFFPPLILNEVKQEVASLEEIDKFSFDFSDSSKSKETYKKMYFSKTSDNKDTTVPITRRDSLWSLLENIKDNIRRMSSSSSPANWMRFDPQSTSAPSSEKPQFSCRLDLSNTDVLLNANDYDDLFTLYGSASSGMFANTKSPTFDALNQLRSAGVQFVPVPNFAPGVFRILDRRCFKVLIYYDKYFEEEFDFGLVFQQFKHLFARVLLFSYYPGKLLIPSKFQPSSAWISAHKDEILK